MDTESFTHVRKEFRPLCLEADEVRCRHILKPRVIEYEAGASLKNEVHFLMHQPQQVRASGLVVMGRAGNGKTSIGYAICRRYNPTFVKEGPKTKPVVMISLTNCREARTIYNRILDDMHAPVSVRSTVADRERVVIRLLRTAGTKLMVFDEIQDVLLTTPRQQELALNTIKLLMNELRIPILALGIQRAAEAMKADPHLKARFTYRELPPWESSVEMRDFLAALETTIPLRERSNLSSGEIMGFLANYSEGVLAQVVKLVNFAALFAVLTKEERITIPLLKRAYYETPPANLITEEVPE